MSTATVTETAVRMLTIGQLFPSEHNPRKTIDAAELSELVGSIQQIGIQIPLLVRSRVALSQWVAAWL